MYNYHYIRNINEYFHPKTPAAASIAVESNLAPIEALVYAAGNIGPVSEEPLDYDAIERVLAGEDLGIDTNLFLLDIFKKLIKHEDPEIALFAAESINAIENRYNKKIENLQELLSQIVDTESLRNLAQLLYELALINQSSITIKKFYLKEAYICYRNLENEDDLTPEDLLRAVRILMELKLFEHARKVVKNQNPRRSNIDLLILEAEINFAEGNISKVFPIMAELSLMTERLDEVSLGLLSHWLAV